MTTLQIADDTRRQWTFTGYEISRLWLEYEMGLLCTSTPPVIGSLSIRISAPFTVRSSTGEIFCDPAETLSIGSALAVLHAPLRSLTAWADGRLDIELGTGLRVVVNRNPQYESWEVVGDGELAEISMLCSAHDAAPWGGA
jgi:hypothetical protein